MVQDVDAMGGSERQARLLAEALGRAGERVCLITSCGAGPLGRPAGPLREVQGGVEVWRLPLLGFEAAASLIAARAGCDLLYAVGIMMGSFAQRIGRVLQAPVVVKLAGMGAPGDIATLGRLPVRARARLSRELATTTLVCVGEAVEAEARGAGFTRLARIPNGVAVEEPGGDLDPALTSLASGAVLYVGRLQHAKGVDLLVSAWAEVPRGTLLLAGEGPERGALEAQVAALGLGERVRFLGRRTDVPALLRVAQAFVLPSRSEGLSNALLEALAAGAPVVASAIPPNLEVLQGAPGQEAPEGQEAQAPKAEALGAVARGEAPWAEALGAVARGEAPWAEARAGVVVTPEDPHALAAGLAALLEDPPLRARLSAAGPARVRARYGIDAVAARYRELFASLPPARADLLGPARFLRARAATLRRLLTR